MQHSNKSPLLLTFPCGDETQTNEDAEFDKPADGERIDTYAGKQAHLVKIHVQSRVLLTWV